MSTLADRLRSQARTDPQQVAIHLQHAGGPDAHMTYQRLLDGAMRFAGVYAHSGVRPGDVVVLILRHGEELIDSFWGAVMWGAIPSIMPFLTEKLAPARYRSDLRLLISVTLPTAIVTYTDLESEIRAAADGSSVKAIIKADRDVPAMRAGESWPPGNESRNAEEVALLQHSSGTTGLQKGVALSHRAVFRQIDAYGRALQLNSKDVIVSWLPLYHDMGLIAGFLLPVLAGVPLILSSPFDWVRAPWRLLRAVSDYRGTLSWLPNFAFNFCAHKVRDRDLEGVDLSSWRAVINCSEPVRWESHRSFAERFEKHGLRPSALQTCYAMAENVFGVTQSKLESGPAIEDIDRAAFMEQRVARPAEGTRPALRTMSSGVPLPNTRVQIISTEGEPVADGQVGEIAIQSDCMMNAYYNRPDADREAFRDGWYLTGDYGYFSRGELYVSGRRKDLIIVGGKNVYPQDLEALSYEVPGVHAGRSVAFGVFNDEAGTEDVYLVAEGDSEDSEDQQRLADLIRNHVTSSSAVALRHVKVVGPKWIIKTSSGKTARLANREKFLREIGAASA